LAGLQMPIFCAPSAWGDPNSLICTCGIRGTFPAREGAMRDRTASGSQAA